jgi:branched-chain amino acid transport system ATP-binding protein
MADVLEVRDLRLAFGGQEVLGGVSFGLAPGRCLGLIGPNGAGKTSIFNCISRVYRPTGGDVRHRGESLLGVPPHKIAGRGIARTFQGVDLLPTSTVLRNVLTGAHPLIRATCGGALLGSPRSFADERSARRRAHDVLGALGLDDVANVPVGQLPYGRQKLVDIARAVLSGPSVLMLDEPAAGTSEQERVIIADYVRGLLRGGDLAVMLVEHDIKFVTGLADTMLALDFGQVIAQGLPGEVVRDQRVIDSYLGGV